MPTGFKDGLGWGKKRCRKAAVLVALAAHSEGKMPSPPGPVAGRSHSQTPGALLRIESPPFAFLKDAADPCA